MRRIAGEAMVGQVEEPEVSGGQQLEKADRRGDAVAQAPARERRSVYGLVQSCEKRRQDDAVREDCRSNPDASACQANGGRRAQQQPSMRPETEQARCVRTARQAVDLCQRRVPVHAEIVSALGAPSGYPARNGAREDLPLVND